MVVYHFLDMLLHNYNRLLSSSWFRKPTDTGLTLNFHSLAPMKYKRSVIIGFVQRIYRSCSTWKNIHSGLESAKNILLNNQYPLTLIEDVFKKTLHKLIDSNSNLDVSNFDIQDNSLDEHFCIHNISEKDKFLFFVNYRGKPTESFAHSLRKLNAPYKVINFKQKQKQTQKQKQKQKQKQHKTKQ